LDRLHDSLSLAPISQATLLIVFLVTFDVVILHCFLQSYPGRRRGSDLVCVVDGTCKCYCGDSKQMSSSEPLKAEDQIVEADDAITGDALADSDKIDSKVMDSRGVSVHRITHRHHQ
jgi:hypothetical protein